MVLLGRRLKWQEVLAHPHGWIYAEKEFAHFSSAVTRILREKAHACG